MGVVTKRAVKYLWFQGMLDYEKQLALLPCDAKIPRQKLPLEAVLA
jgi:hypothetical protein